ncbi:MAG: hypothetical protein ACYC3I_11115 [Gemmataceae bacterium]
MAEAPFARADPMPLFLPSNLHRHLAKPTAMVLATLGALAVLVSVYPCSSAAVEARSLDLQGDPLPKEAVAHIGSGRMRHGIGAALPFAPDGKSLISGGGGRLRIWNAETGKLRRNIDIAANSRSAFAFVSEGIAVADYVYDKGVVTCRDAATTATMNRPLPGDFPRIVLVESASEASYSSGEHSARDTYHALLYSSRHPRTFA